MFQCQGISHIKGEKVGPGHALPFWTFLKDTNHNMTGIDPRHRQIHLSLLPSGPDEVHDCLLRGDQPEQLAFSARAFKKEFSPA
jgi:hypothetical protein